MKRNSLSCRMHSRADAHSWLLTFTVPRLCEAQAAVAISVAATDAAECIQHLSDADASAPERERERDC